MKYILLWKTFLKEYITQALYTCIYCTHMYTVYLKWKSNLFPSVSLHLKAFVLWACFQLRIEKWKAFYIHVIYMYICTFMLEHHKIPLQQKNYLIHQFLFWNFVPWIFIVIFFTYMHMTWSEHSQGIVLIKGIKCYFTYNTS